MVIDFSAHHVPEAVIDAWEETQLGKRKPFAYARQNADPEVRLGLMEKYGIDMQAVSLSAPILLAFNAAEAAEMCLLANTKNYELCRKYPKKFVNICIFSLLDVEKALDDLKHSMDELDCRGVTIATNQKGRGLDSQEYLPFYEMVADKDLPILLHPTNWGTYPLVDLEQGWRMMMIFGWPFDTTQAVWRLIFGGVVDRYPSLKVVTHHLGAMLPYFSSRIEQNVEKFLSDKLPRKISDYWGNIYGDTALDGTVAAYPCGYAFFGPDRVLFGTDYPYGLRDGEDLIDLNLAGVKAMDIPQEHKEKIMWRNAKKLLKID